MSPRRPSSDFDWSDLPDPDELATLFHNFDNPGLFLDLPAEHRERLMRGMAYVYRAIRPRAASHAVPKPTNVIYAIEAVGSDLVKLGVSTNPASRLRQLQAANGTALRLVASRPGGYTEERALHERFASYRTNGEWFRHTGAVAVEVAKWKAWK